MLSICVPNTSSAPTIFHARLAAANNALRFWLHGGFSNKNWYWNEIGVPQLLCDIFRARGPSEGPLEYWTRSALRWIGAVSRFRVS